MKAMKAPGRQPAGTAISGISVGPNGINQSKRPGIRSGGSVSAPKRGLQKMAGVRPVMGRRGRR